MAGHIIPLLIIALVLAALVAVVVVGGRAIYRKVRR